MGCVVRRILARIKCKRSEMAGRTREGGGGVTGMSIDEVGGTHEKAS